MTESDHSEEVERVVETHSQQQQLSGLGERPSEARYQETDAEIREPMPESCIGWPMFDRDEDEEPPPSHERKAKLESEGAARKRRSEMAREFWRY